MFFFNRKKKKREAELHEKEVAVSLAVKEHQKNVDSAIKETVKKTGQLSRSLRRNHITLQIYATTGGKR